jgi:hypothetical protein
MDNANSKIQFLRGVAMKLRCTRFSAMIDTMTERESMVTREREDIERNLKMLLHRNLKQVTHAQVAVMQMLAHTV